MRLFISYAKLNKKRVDRLVALLREGGLDPWYDHRLLPGQNWKAELLKEIAACDQFVYVLTPESVASEWCQWEFKQAVDLEKPIVPILLDRSTNLPDSLRQIQDIQYADFSGRTTNEAAVRLTAGIYRKGVILPKETVADPPTNPHGFPAQVEQKIAPPPASPPDPISDIGHPFYKELHDSQMKLVGTVIDGYRLTKLLNPFGGSTYKEYWSVSVTIDRSDIFPEPRLSIYLAQSTKDGHEATLKIPVFASKFLRYDSYLAEMFWKEVTITSTLNHKNVVNVLMQESGDKTKPPYLMIPYFNAGSLKDTIQREGILLLHQAVRLTTQVSQGLDYLHSQNVIHGDVKPSNIMISNKGYPVLIDFGLALESIRVREAKDYYVSVYGGTFGYMPPEKLSSDWGVHGPTRQADIFELGATVFHMLTGKAPFSDQEKNRYTHSGYIQGVISAATHRFKRTVPKSIFDVLEIAMAEDPQQRFGSVGEFVRAFKMASK